MAIQASKRSRGFLYLRRDGEEEARIVFNHKHAAASVWDDDELKEEFNYSTEYPDGVLPWKTVSF
ncbi:hypothetical protein ACI2J5_23075 [Agrobacterium pusense]|uniref:hypothetical protein n=1 Tax=Agrobacterium pusense TaxID=648995 RepID=UPI00126A1F8C